MVKTSTISLMVYIVIKTSFFFHPAFIFGSSHVHGPGLKLHTVVRVAKVGTSAPGHPHTRDAYSSYYSFGLSYTDRGEGDRLPRRQKGGRR